MQYKYQLCFKKYMIRNIVYMQYAVYKLTSLLYYLCTQMQKNVGKYYLT